LNLSDVLRSIACLKRSIERMVSRVYSDLPIAKLLSAIMGFILRVYKEKMDTKTRGITIYIDIDLVIFFIDSFSSLAQIKP